MNKSITKLETEIKASQEENTSLQEMLSGLQEQLKIQQDGLQAASGDKDHIKW